MTTQCVTAQIEGSPYGLNRLPHLGSSLLQVLIPNEVQACGRKRLGKRMLVAVPERSSSTLISVLSWSR